MSLILEGIDIPTEGEWLEVIIKPTKEVIVDTIRYRDNALLKTEYESAIQIPKGHGRLIDENKIDIPSTSVDMFENCRNCHLLDDEQVKEIISNAPTILEAKS